MIYLDSAATTKVLPQAAEAAVRAMCDCYGNPSSLHNEGYRASKRLEECRKTIAEAAGVDPSCLIFTSGGSASNNLAIKGFLSNKRKGKVITSAYEHPSVMECFKLFEDKLDVVYLKPENGIITEEALLKVLDEDTILVSIMHVNNEPGAINPIKELCKLTKKLSHAVFHTDAVQGFMKENLSYSFADMVSFSGHKNHAPKGIGALYVKKGIKLLPVISGGGQEKGFASGTENLPGAEAWAEAVKIQLPERVAHKEHAMKLKNLTRDLLADTEFIEVSPEKSSPYVFNAVFPSYLSENLLHYLSERNICVSTGSACSSKKASHVFVAIGMPEYSKSALRISYSYDNTEDDIRQFASVLKQGLSDIIKIR